MRSTTRTSRIALSAAMLAAVAGSGWATTAALDDDPSPVAVVPAAAVDEAASPEAQGAGAAAPTAAPADAPETPMLGAAQAGSGEAPTPIPIDDHMIECGAPPFLDEEELALATAEAEELLAVLGAAGQDASMVIDPSGFPYVEWDFESGIAMSVVNSFHRNLYPNLAFPDDVPFLEEDLAFMVEENAGLMAALEAAGLDFELVVGEDGWEWVEWNYEDPAAARVVEAYYAEFESRFGTDYYPAEPPTPEELEWTRAENEALAELLTELGVPFELVVDDVGWEWVEWESEDPEVFDRVDRFYAEFWEVAFDEGEVAFFEEAYSEGAFPGDEFLDEACEWPEPTAEELAVLQAEVDELARVFADAGIEHEVRIDEFGYPMVEWDYGDPAAEAVLNEHYERLSAAFVEAVSADLDRLSAAFDAAGIQYEREGHDECETVIFDIEDPVALEVVASLG